MPNPRLAGFYKLSVGERLERLRDAEILSVEDYATLSAQTQRLTLEQADRLVENVVGTFSLPFGVALNFLVNGKDYVAPMAVEEPSIIAAVSSAAKVAAMSGGFQVTSDEPRLIGQVQVVGLSDADAARERVLEAHEELINLANSLQPNMVARGGGAREVEVVVHNDACARGDIMVVHLVVDTRDAMGANLVNTMCEGIAPLVEKLSGGDVLLRILSNLTDRAMVHAEVSIDVEHLARGDFSGERVRDGIVLANDFAAIDPYRAATHNKGIMNGVDAVAVATGNDWRAIEAAAHAYAGRGDGYTALTRWWADPSGALRGRLEIPLKVATVGGQVQSNPAVGLAQRMVGVQSARELAELMGAVGLAQNFAALRALSTEGIQRGHMNLHARSVAAAAGASGEVFEQVVERLVEEGEIKVWKAKSILSDLTTGPKRALDSGTTVAAGYGKIVLLGEHAGVYDRHVLAAPIPLGVEAAVSDAEGSTSLNVIPWNIQLEIRDDRASTGAMQQSLALIYERLGLSGRHFTIDVAPHLPRAMGLGSSAALAVAVTRALANHCDVAVTDDEVNAIALECDRFAHGTPSGVDNALATYGQLMLYKSGRATQVEELEAHSPIPLVVGLTGVESLTATMVERVREARDANTHRIDRLFDLMDDLTLRAVPAVRENDLEVLGELMNMAHGLLSALGVSSAELDGLVHLARKSGALGAKLTGSGGGGAIVAVCEPGTGERIVDAMRAVGYRGFEIEVGAPE